MRAKRLVAFLVSLFLSKDDGHPSISQHPRTVAALSSCPRLYANSRIISSSSNGGVQPSLRLSMQFSYAESSSSSDNSISNNNYRPLPAMPSELFQQLALSQLELLANSLRDTSPTTNEKSKSKINSMALYLPQENANTGQLEFLPAVIYPDPHAERIFLASEAGSGVAPRLPRLLTKLPGFAAPDSLLPRYPMVSGATTTGDESSSFAGVGVAEDVLCDLQSGTTALSVPLFLGSQTVGVLLVSPSISSSKNRKNTSNKASTEVWTKEDREQIIRAAQTLSMALSMDNERSNLEMENKRVQDALSNSLHQVKNPLQALRTFGKLLQQRVAEQNENSAVHLNTGNSVGTIRQLLDLTQNMMEQSDRVVNLLEPMDSIVDSLDNKSKNNNLRAPLLYLNPAPPDDDDKAHSLVLWNQTNTPSLPWESDTLEFARRGQESTSRPLSKSRQQPSPTTARYLSRSTTNATISASDMTSNSNSQGSTLEFSSRGSRAPPNRRRNTNANQPQSRPATTSTSSTLDWQKQPKSQVTNFERKPPVDASSSQRSSTQQQEESASIVGDDGLEIGFILDVLGPIFSTYKMIGAERGISFQVVGLDLAEELPGVLVRPKSLQEAVSNLLDNALKYVAVTAASKKQPSGGVPPEDPKVRVRLLANSGDQPSGVTIIVDDNGPGILPEEAETIFERGFRSSSVSSWVLGTGLGLGLARALVESMGGTLDCLNQNDYSGAYPNLMEGAAFRIQLYRNKDSLRAKDFAPK